MQKDPDNSSGLESTWEKELKLINTLHEDLEKIHTHLLNYLNQLEGHPVGREPSQGLRNWHIIFSVVMGSYLKQQMEYINEVINPHDSEELAPETRAHLAHCLITALSKPNLPADTSEEIKEFLREIQRVLYRPYEFNQIKPTADIARQYPGDVIAQQYKITYLVQSLARIALLIQLADGFEFIQEYMAQHPEKIEATYPALKDFNFSWLMTQYAQIYPLFQYPNRYVSSLAPFQAAIPIPNAPPQQLKVIQDNAWEQIAFLKETIVWTEHFGLARLWQGFSGLRSNRIAPFSPWVQLAFWLNIPLIYNIFSKGYFQSFKHTLQACRDYLNGKSAWWSLFSFQENNQYSLLLTIPWELSKLLVAPVILVGMFIQGTTSYPLNLLREGWQKRWQWDQKIKKTVLMLIDSIDGLKDLGILIGGLYGWSSLLGVIPLGTTLGASATLAATSIAVGTAFLLLFTLTHLPFVFLAEIGYQNPFLPLFNLMNSSLLRLLWVISLVSAPLTLLTLGVGRLTLNGYRFFTHPLKHSPQQEEDDDHANRLAALLEPPERNPPPSLFCASLPLQIFRPSQSEPKPSSAQGGSPLEESWLLMSSEKEEKQTATSDQPVKKAYQ